MYVTACIKNADIQLGFEYQIAEHHTQYCGTSMTVIAGPHADFDTCPVYTVKLHNPRAKCDMPFFNSRMHSAFEHVDIEII
jgi:hypothetical protein